MSVKVNLLPREFEQRARGRRVVGLTAVFVLLVVVGLSFLYVTKQTAVEEAREARDTEQAEVARLRAELAELQEFRDLADRLQARNEVLAFAMGAEISWASMLNDLSMTFPASSSLRTLTGTVEQEEAGVGEIDVGRRVASLTFTGYSVERYAPGVEVVIVEFDKGDAFFNTFITTATREEIGNTPVHEFNGNVHLDEEAYTLRYFLGLPVEVSP